MKALFILLFSLFVLLSSCRHSAKPSDGDQEVSEEVVDTLPKATAIFWIDKEKNVYSKQKRDPLPIRTVKAKVTIYSTGRVELLSYAKPQESHVHKYLQQKLEVFRVSKVMLDSGFVKPGEQYVQLRYIPGKVNK